jgi:NAD(P)-dependent dehydrogenase (short-subunit alcohol dehydrogenase family)
MTTRSPGTPPATASKAGTLDRGRGAIINFSSVSGFRPVPYNAGYAAAKTYVLWLSEAVRAEVAGTSVTVTAVCHGPVVYSAGSKISLSDLILRYPDGCPLWSRDDHTAERRPVEPGDLTAEHRVTERGHLTARIPRGGLTHRTPPHRKRGP